MKIAFQICFMDNPGLERLASRLGIHLDIIASIYGRSGVFFIDESEKNWPEILEFVKKNGI